MTGSATSPRCSRRCRSKGRWSSCNPRRRCKPCHALSLVGRVTGRAVVDAATGARRDVEGRYGQGGWRHEPREPDVTRSALQGSHEMAAGVSWAALFKDEIEAAEVPNSVETRPSTNSGSPQPMGRRLNLGLPPEDVSVTAPATRKAERSAAALRSGESLSRRCRPFRRPASLARRPGSLETREHSSCAGFPVIVQRRRHRWLHD